MKIPELDWSKMTVTHTGEKGDREQGILRFEVAVPWKLVDYEEPDIWETHELSFSTTRNAVTAEDVIIVKHTPSGIEAAVAVREGESFIRAKQRVLAKLRPQVEDHLAQEDAFTFTPREPQTFPEKK